MLQTYSISGDAEGKPHPDGEMPTDFKLLPLIGDIVYLGALPARTGKKTKKTKQPTPRKVLTYDYVNTSVVLTRLSQKELAKEAVKKRPPRMSLRTAASVAAEHEPDTEAAAIEAAATAAIAAAAAKADAAKAAVTKAAANKNAETVKAAATKAAATKVDDEKKAEATEAAATEAAAAKAAATTAAGKKKAGGTKKRSRNTKVSKPKKRKKISPKKMKKKKKGAGKQKKRKRNNEGADGGATVTAGANKITRSKNRSGAFVAPRRGRVMASEAAMAASAFKTEGKKPLDVVSSTSDSSKKEHTVFTLKAVLKSFEDPRSAMFNDSLKAELAKMPELVTYTPEDGDFDPPDILFTSRRKGYFMCKYKYRGTTIGVQL